MLKIGDTLKHEAKLAKAMRLGFRTDLSRNDALSAVYAFEQCCFSQDEYWFLVQVKHGKINEFCELMAEYSFEVWRPEVKYIRKTKGRRHAFKKYICENYIFVQMRDINYGAIVLEAYEAVISVIKSTNGPAILRNFHINYWKESIDKVVVMIKKAAKLKKDSLVNIIDCVFAGYSGKVVEVLERQDMLKLSVEMIGQTAIVQLPLDKVLFYD